VAFAAKEKAALQAILEGKALPLAQQLARGLSDALDAGSSPGAGAIFANRGADDSTERLQRQVAALQRLLGATVAAMARAGPLPGGTPGGSMAGGPPGGMSLGGGGAAPVTHAQEVAGP